MRIPVAIGAAALLLVLPVAQHGLTGGPGATPGIPDTAAVGADLVSAVTASTLRLGNGARPLIDVEQRSTTEWGFGSAVLTTAGVAAYPEAWLFLAHREGGRWRVALQGEPDFAALGAVAPILAPAERRVLAGDATTAAGGEDAGGTPGRGSSAGQGGGGATPYGDRRTVVGLPYAEGQSWLLGSGPHPMGEAGVRSALDFTGGDGIVRAAADGIAYTMCGGRGWVRVLHARGYATDYYHLTGNIDVDGQIVQAGDFLGHIGNDVSCGGYSSGAHVHFSLMHGGQYVELDGYSLGQWVISAGATSRTGTLRHGSRVVGVGDPVHNYGPQALNQGVIDTLGRLGLPRRSGPGDRYPIIDWIPDGATVSVLCSTRGPQHRTRSAYVTTLWNRLVDGGYVSDAFLTTGTSGPVRGYCP